MKAYMAAIRDEETKVICLGAENTLARRSHLASSDPEMLYENF